MVSRGYAGSMPVIDDVTASRAQWAYAAALPVAALVVCLLGWMPDEHCLTARRTASLEVSGLAYAYPDGHQALFGVDLTVGRGERVALLGPNGAGKTTLVLHLNGILDGGRGHRDRSPGCPVEQAATSPRSAAGSASSSRTPTTSSSCRPSARTSPSGPPPPGCAAPSWRSGSHEALDQVGMADFADRPPHHLSFGQRRRVAVATVLAMRPEILVLDEPSSNLDPASRRELADILRSLDVTVLMVTHDLPYALELCPRAVILSDGVIAADGPTQRPARATRS